MPPENYVSLVLNELEQNQFFSEQPLDTLYFGGGTPSLISASLIVSLIQGLEKRGYPRRPGAEVTIEINPATVGERKLEIYLENGINRFSVGAQTFDDRLLKMVRREHSAQQTLQTLALLKKYNLNYSFDVLFALPSQTKDGLLNDLEIAVELGAKHISPYCLTVPAGHPLAKGRAPEDEQVEMFEAIRQKLSLAGYAQYEISNFAKPGFESKHNVLYWDDQEYWGLGLSAHSYSRKTTWGTRFWNQNNMGGYEAQIVRDHGRSFQRPEGTLPDSQYEILKAHQAMTDFCHTSLRMMRGLSLERLGKRFPAELSQLVQVALESLVQRQFLSFDNGHWSLTQKGILLSNTVYSELTFLEEDLPLTN